MLSLDVILSRGNINVVIIMKGVFFKFPFTYQTLCNIGIYASAYDLTLHSTVNGRITTKYGIVVTWLCG